jgi:predicted CXXCH cytochrome family protein
VHVRLRHITTRRSGAKAVREETLDVGRLRIGRATGCDVPLSGLTVALEHAVVEQRGDRTWIQAASTAEIRVNGHTTSGRVLDTGDVVRIGSHELRIAAPEPGEDLVVEIEQVAGAMQAGGGLHARSNLRLSSTLPAPQAMAWVAALIVFGAVLAAPFVLWRVAPDERDEAAVAGRAGGSGALGAAAPIGTISSSTAAASSPGAATPGEPGASQNVGARPTGWTRGKGDAQAEVRTSGERDSAPMKALRSLMASWNPGPLSTGHAHVADRCEKCHVESFRSVPDRACIACHGSIAAHVAAARNFKGFTSDRCGSCHVEHRGPQALIVFSDSFCARCHGDLATRIRDTAYGDVESFGEEHPEFRASVVAEVGGGDRRRIELANTPAEHSGLTFPHEKHLVPRLRAPAGEVQLVCADCHTPDASGATMKPIAFAKDCQRCHSLAFDELHGDRQAPHAEPAAVRQGVLEFYATLALTGQARDPQAPEIARRRPGRDLTEPERLEALRWAEARTDSAVNALLGANGPCDECHAISQADTSYQVAPVHVVPFKGAARWLPLAKFSHEAHGAVQCERCHAARTAASSEAVLLPSIETCRDCHAGERAAHGKVSSPCLLCHDFHHAELGPMRPELQTAAGDPAKP